MTLRIPRILLILAALALLASLAGCGGGGSASPGGWVINDQLFTPNFVADLLADPEGGLYHWDHLPMRASFHLPADWVATYGDTHVQGAGEWTSGAFQMIQVVAWGAPADVTVEFVNQTTFGGSTWGRTTYSHYPATGLMASASIQIALWRPNGTSIAAGDARVLIAHELGHALGLGGHSRTATDLMYTTHIFGTARPTTVQDINTAKTAYPSYFGVQTLQAEGTRGGIVTRVIE